VQVPSKKTTSFEVVRRMDKKQKYGLTGKRWNRHGLFFLALIFCRTTTVLAVEIPDAPLESVTPFFPLKEQDVGGTRFTIPGSTRMELAAGQPQIRWPVAAAWDHDRTLLVLESNWNRESVQQQLQSKPHRIVRLTDSDRDGMFDLREIVAKNLPFAAGLLVVDEDTLLVSAPPTIVRLDDQDADGVYETESVWHDGRTLTYCANDLHGPMRGLDGWIYWTKGAFDEQSHQLRDGNVLKSRAAHLLRRHPDGGEVDVLMSGGMDNPVDVAFLPDGERLFCSTFLHHPGNGLRDGIAHAIYGSLFGKSNDVLDDHPSTGPLMEPIEEMGPAAPASLTLLTSSHVAQSLGIELPDSCDQSYLTTCQFNFHKISLHRITPQGSTFATQSQDLLATDRVDFHPVDVLEDTDGSLLILDTGGWYDLCCPSSGTPGQTAPGGIYRLSPEKVIEKSADSELDSFLTPSEKMAAVADDQVPPRTRLKCFWNLVGELVTQPDNASIRRMVLDCLTSSSQPLQRAALNTVSLYRWIDSEPILIPLLQSDSPMTRRLAAECLGRLQESDNDVTSSLMQAIDDQANDRALQHAILYAMIDRCSPRSVRNYLSSKLPSQNHAALVVLEQTHQVSAADSSVILDLMKSKDAKTSALALEIMTAHPEFAGQLVDSLKAAWSDASPESQRTLTAMLGQWWRVAEVQSLIEIRIADHARFEPWQAELMIGVLAKVRGESLPNSWVAPLAGWMSQADSTTATQIAGSLAEVSWEPTRNNLLIDAIKSRVNDANLPMLDRVRLASTLPFSTPGLSDDVIEFITDGLSGDDETTRLLSLSAIPRIKLTTSTSQSLIKHLGNLSPLALQPALIAVLSVNDTSLDAAVIESISQANSSKSIAASSVLSVLKDRPVSVRKQWSAMFEKLAAPPDDIIRAVDDWLGKLPAGDAVRGHQVFRSAQASCSQCHQVGDVGGNVGPELSKIGQTRLRRDLIEAIVFPSARLEQSYRSTKVLMDDGRVYNGIVADQSETKMELICNANERRFLSMDEIELVQPSDVSIMPAGLEQSLTLEQLADLIAFLETCR
jgi:putative membrane-bound dehydrogenase-like protein